VFPTGHTADALARPAIDDVAADEVRLEEFIFLQRHSLFEGNSDFGAREGFGVGDGIHAAEFEDQRLHVEPNFFHRITPALAEQVHFPQCLEALRFAAHRKRRDFSAVAPGFAQNGNRDPSGLGQAHSRISSVKRRFSFIPAAPRMVRIERAVRPCLPITFPRSLGATFNSRTVTCSPSTTRTETSSGMSTRALAMSSINCFMHPASMTMVARPGQKACANRTLPRRGWPTRRSFSNS